MLRKIKLESVMLTMLTGSNVEALLQQRITCFLCEL